MTVAGVPGVRLSEIPIRVNFACRSCGHHAMYARAGYAGNRPDGSHYYECANCSDWVQIATASPADQMAALVERLDRIIELLDARADQEGQR